MKVFISGTGYCHSGFTLAAVFILVLVGCGTSTGPEIPKQPPFQPPEPFVEVADTNFVTNGEIFRFVGTNAYYLPNYEKLDPRVVNRALDSFENTGISVIRMWAFYDGYDCGFSKNNPAENVIQTAPGQYSEEALINLDRVIAKGKERGIRFILPLINYWDELGGICQYNTWDNADDPGLNMNHFLNSSNTQKWFKDYIVMLLNRVNTVTGVAYKDEPAIHSWQIMNEGRNRGQSPVILRNWYQEIAQFIKSIDSNHLVSTGEEGYEVDSPPEYSIDQYTNIFTLQAPEGTSFLMNVAIPEIDYANSHWYPTEWGFGYQVGEDMMKSQRAWLDDHNRIAREHGKPFILDEYGYAGWGNESVFNLYSALWEQAEELKLDGSLLWQFTADYVKCYEFGGNICWPAGRQDTNLYNGFRNHLQTIQNGQ